MMNVRRDLKTGVAVSLLGFLAVAPLGACEPAATAPPPVAAAPCPTSTSSSAASHSAEDEDVRWLVQHSMLEQGATAARRYSGTGQMWLHPYANPQPRAASAMASVWFTAYPASTITRPADSVLKTLGDAELWKVFQDIGIKGMHTGPMKRAGGLKGHEYTPTIDGNFDRISAEIDPAFGTEDEYKALTKNARSNGAIVIGDIIPGHSGKGADFRLAERAYRDYPGIYHMVEIGEKDWSLLPRVPAGKDAVNLKPEAVDQLKARGYVVGQLPRTIFFEKGIKDTDWSATDTVTGVDGKSRRWVYLHYFKDGQPTFNWLDPSFAAQRLVLGDAMHSIGTLGESMLRLDANGFLGIETGAGGARAYSEGHPLSVTSNQIIAGMVRKLGGFTFQELNLTLEDIKAMSQGGPDLSYDFVTRPAYQHALVTGDAEFLRLMLGLQKTYKIDPASLIHALQNHDELTVELVHFWTGHKDDIFTFRGKKMKGSALRDLVRDDVHTKLLAPAAPYNLKASNGVSCTNVSLAAASLGIAVKDWTQLTAPQKADIQGAHLLLAMYNAMQPGVFALSGWDLVGAATLPAESVKAQIADGDTRWINRGAYDLLGVNPSAQKSSNGLPRAYAVYGSLPEQLKTPASFAAQLKKMLKVRTEYRIYESEQVDVPAVKATGLLVMVHKLPANKGLEVTVLNFGKTAVQESVAIEGAPADAAVQNLLEDKSAGKLAGKRLALSLQPRQGQVLLIK